MTVYVLLTVEDDQLLPKLITTMVQSSVRFTVAKDLKNLCPHIDPTPSGSSQKPLVPYLEASTSKCCPQEPLDKVPKLESDEIEDHSTQVEVGEEDRSNMLLLHDQALSLFNAGLSEENDEGEKPEDSEQTIRGRKNGPRQCQLCQQWITVKNIRAHCGTHMALSRLKCSGCDKTFARMNRGLLHLKQIHQDDPNIRIKNAVTAEQLAALNELRWKCFPPICCCKEDCSCK